MFLTPYIYESNISSNQAKILIILPDIFGLNKGNKQMIDDFSSQTGFKTFGLDYFYQITNTATNLDFNSAQKAVELMNGFKGEDFVLIFDKALDAILSKFPNPEKIAVCGFCFGGRLSLLSALNQKINSVISFYGAGVHKPDFYNEKSLAQILEENPEITKSKDFLLFFGDLDQSIPLVEINMTQNLLNSQSKSYDQVIYANANHAFFNKERSSFVPEIYDEIVDKIKNFLN